VPSWSFRSPPWRAPSLRSRFPGATPPGNNGKLVFERETRDGSDMFTIGADGSGLTRLTLLRGTQGDSSWSPDGSKVAFTRARDPERGPYEIWAVNADGSGLKRLTRHRGFSIAPAWSPDGGNIVYATNAGRRERTRPTPSFHRTARGSRSPATVTTGGSRRSGSARASSSTRWFDGSGIVRVTANRRPDVFPDWQPLP